MVLLLCVARDALVEESGSHVLRHGKAIRTGCLEVQNGVTAVDPNCFWRMDQAQFNLVLLILCARVREREREGVPHNTYLETRTMNQGI